MVKKRKNVIVTIALMIFLIIGSNLFTYIVFSQSGFVPRDIYIDDIPVTASFVIRYDGVAYYWATRSDGYIAYNNTVLTSVQDSVVSALTSGGGTIFCAEVEWDDGTDIPSNILVIQDYQGKRSYYTSQNIDFNQAQLEEGVFHAGTTPPASPTMGQWFYDTDDYNLYIYNGTAWDSTSGVGVSDHGDLSGLDDDDHTQYLLADGTRDVTGNLDMSQYQLENGVFHKGTSFPETPVEGQYFYRTDLDAFYVYNGTGWESPEGSVGPPGESGSVEGLPFNYLVFSNVTSTYAVNGITGAIDYSGVPQQYCSLYLMKLRGIHLLFTLRGK